MVRGNGPIRFGSRTGCRTFVFRADVETPGGRGVDDEAFGCLAFFCFQSSFARPNSGYRTEMRKERKRDFAILQKGGCGDMMDLDMICTFLFCV